MGKKSEKQTTGPTVSLVSHSAIFYWWPVWVMSVMLYLLTEVTGAAFSTAQGDQTVQVIRSPTPGIVFSVVLLLLIAVNSFRFRRLAALILAAVLLGGVGIFAWMGWLDALIRVLPSFDVRMSSGYYLLIALILGGLWGLNFAVFDRLVFWRVKGGRLEKVWRLKGPVQSFDLAHADFRHGSDNALRHIVFGLGSGDVTIRVNDSPDEQIILQNVLHIRDKLRAIKSLRQPVSGIGETLA